MEQSSKVLIQMQSWFSDGEEQEWAEVAWMNVKLQSIFVSVMEVASSSFMYHCAPRISLVQNTCYEAISMNQRENLQA